MGMDFPVRKALAAWVGVVVGTPLVIPPVRPLAPLGANDYPENEKQNADDSPVNNTYHDGLR